TEPAFLERLLALPEATRSKTVLDAVLKEIRRVMSVDTAGAFDIERPLQELGMDSLMALEIRNGLGRLLGNTLPTAILFKYPTANDLAGFIMEEYVHAAAPQTKNEAGAKSDVDSLLDLDVLEGLSDGEIDSLLA
ncbi:MAG: acyl carrier protein, partial [Gammaproteobacteria bacterium]